MEYSNSVFNRAFPFWNDISENERETIRKSSAIYNYPKGTQIAGGDSCAGVFIVNSGCLRVYIMSDEGKEITLYRLHEGEMCMLAASCVIQAITFDVYISAEEDSECCVVAGFAFAEVSDNNPAVKIFALETAVTRFSDVMWVMQQILFMGMDKRLAIFLNDESARLHSDFIPLTHEQIAKYIGSAREVVSRVMKYFSSENIVETSRKGVTILDKKRLRELLV